MRKEINSQRIVWVHQQGRPFIALERQYGCRDVCENALGSGEKLIKYQAKYILCDHVLNSHDHSALQSIAIRRNLMLITLRV